MQTAETEIVQRSESLSQCEIELPAPAWLVDNKIHEVAFCRELLSEHKVKCINNQLPVACAISLIGTFLPVKVGIKSFFILLPPIISLSLIVFYCV